MVNSNGRVGRYAKVGGILMQQNGSSIGTVCVWRRVTLGVPVQIFGMEVMLRVVLMVQHFESTTAT